MFCEVLESLDAVTAQAWDALHDNENPFVSHAFLSGLEQTRCVCDDSGWTPRHLALFADRDRRALVGAAPLYLKSHSYGEYVFDWAWADAYRRCGLDYYPKLVSSVPFTPVSGPRLLARNRPGDDHQRIRDALATNAIALAEDLQVSSLHWLFTNEADTGLLQHNGHLKRIGNQFHWSNAGYTDFDHYLGSLTSKRRKQIRRERRRIDDAGLVLETVTGPALRAEHCATMYRFYCATVAAHGAIAYLNREFFDYLMHAMRDELVLIFARDGGAYVAGAVFMRGAAALYGRYWGAREHYDTLHFEICYYAPIQWCIEQHLDRFEAGAQGEHKLNRGLLPNPTYSAHWLKHPQFSSAVADFLDHETAGVNRYTEALREHSPFRRDRQPE